MVTVITRYYNSFLCVAMVTEVFPEDSGNYSVTVKNQWGDASSMASLQVKG